MKPMVGGIDYTGSAALGNNILKSLPDRLYGWKICYN